MANKKLKEKKKKAKEVATEKQKLAVRLRKIKKEKWENQMIKESTPNQKILPYRKSEDAKYKIERNLQILKALEEEHQKTQKQREEMNRRLEEQGYKTFEEKLNAINANSEEIIYKENMSREQSSEHFRDIKNALEEIETKNISENVEFELKSVDSANDT